MGGRMDIVIDGEMREERVMYIARFWVSGMSTGKMGLASGHILVGACISEGAFLYSKIWDFRYYCRYSQSRWR